MTEQTMLTFETTRGRYTHLPERNLIEQMRKADAKVRRDLRRGHPLVRNYPAPVMPSWGSSREKHADNLLDRTINWIDARLHAGEFVTVHLFRTRFKDKQCIAFNAELDKRYRYRDGVQFKYVDPEEWGFVQKSS